MSLNEMPDTYVTQSNVEIKLSDVRSVHTELNPDAVVRYANELVFASYDFSEVEHTLFDILVSALDTRPLSCADDDGLMVFLPDGTVDASHVSLNSIYEAYNTPDKRSIILSRDVVNKELSLGRKFKRIKDMGVTGPNVSNLITKSIKIQNKLFADDISVNNYQIRKAEEAGDKNEVLRIKAEQKRTRYINVFESIDEIGKGGDFVFTFTQSIIPYIIGLRAYKQYPLAWSKKIKGDKYAKRFLKLFNYHIQAKGKGTPLKISYKNLFEQLSDDRNKISASYLNNPSLFKTKVIAKAMKKINDSTGINVYSCESYTNKRDKKGPEGGRPKVEGVIFFFTPQDKKEKLAVEDIPQYALEDIPLSNYEDYGRFVDSDE